MMMDGDETPTAYLKNLPPQEYYEEINDHPESEHRRSSSQRHQKERRDSSYGGIPSRDLAKMLIEEEQQSSDLKKMLAMLSNQYREEAQRADDADRRSKDIAVRLKATIETKLIMEQDLARLNEELRLYKIQLDKAQKEIFKAQSVLSEVDLQRVEAESAAARARDTARKLKEQRLIELAREEGRRIGIEEGLARGRSAGYNQGRAAVYAQGRLEEAPMEEVRGDDDGAYYGGSHSTSSGPTRAPTPPREQSPPKSPDPPSTRSRSIRKPNPPAFTDAPDRDVPIPPPVTTPLRTPTPQISPPVKLLQTPPVVRPVQIIRTSPSPVIHKRVSIPPDNWIPVLDEGGIRIPPPNQFSPQPSPPGSLPSPLRTVDEEPVFMMRPPSGPPVPDYESAVSNSPSQRSHHDQRRSTDPHVSDYESAVSNSPSHRPHHARRRSTDSQASTTISNLDIVSPPNLKPAHVRDRTLSAITEERSSGVPSPNPNSTSLHTTPSFQPYSSSNLFHPPALSPQSSLHRSSSVSSEEYNIKIVPPSRPMSKSYSPKDSTIFSTGMLSAGDAEKRTLTPQQPPEPPVPQTPVFDNLPPGFVPFTPGGSSVSPAGIPLPPTSVGSTSGSQLAGGTPGYSYHNIPGPGGRMIEEPDTEPVIPNLSGRSRKSSTKSGGSIKKHRKPALTDSDEEISSELGSSDSLTTPPRGKTPLPIYAQTPSSISAATSLPPLTISSIVTPSSAAGSGRTPVRDSAPLSTVTGTPNPGRGRGGRRKR